jgi:hypothetical protein
MTDTLRYVLAAALLLGVLGAALAPAPRRRPAREWRWALRWLAVAALVWAGVSHYLDRDDVALGLIIAFLLLACVEVWLLRSPPGDEPPEPDPDDPGTGQPAAGTRTRAKPPIGQRRPARAPSLWRR